MAAASSPTVTDSGSLISSRLISTGGSGGAGLSSGFGGSGLTSTLGGAAGATGAAAAGRAGTTGAAGRDGTGGAAGRSGGVGTTRRGAAGGAAGPAAAGGARGRGGAAGGGGGVGRSTVGSRRTTGDGVTGAGGGAIEGAGGAATTGEGGGVGKGSGSATGAGAAVCRKSVAAGLISSTGSGSTVSWDSIVTAFLREVFGAVAAAPVLYLRATAAPASPTGGLALGARLGLASSGKSRPRPSFTRRSLAIAACNGLMARIPFWPMASRATIKSLLVTPNSFARSMTLTRAATARLPPRLVVPDPAVQYSHRAQCGRLAGPLDRVPEPARTKGLPETLGIGAHICAPTRSPTTVIHLHSPVDTADQAKERDLGPLLPTPNAGPLRRRGHSAEVLAMLSGGVSPTPSSGAPMPYAVATDSAAASSCSGSAG